MKISLLMSKRFKKKKPRQDKHSSSLIDEEIAVNPDWVVSIVEPILAVLEAYGQTMKPSEEGKAVFGADEVTEPNLSITDTINN